VTGDLSFLYDSNGLWNNYLTPKLRIIVINNGGGGIFRFIPGPSETGHLETYFEAGHDKSVQPLSEMYGLNYLCATNEDDLVRLLPQFFSESEKPVILEVITPKRENAKTLRNYFKRLKEVL
jgi:2-succinyl-5-enolpyruvyl-6-hydroxy-3-cyclohexene-1-carboxylate synthase